jgi:predicted Rossmann fold flavoprotein
MTGTVPAPAPLDAVVVGAGAAGLMTALVAGRERAGIALALLEGSQRAGTKILVSGGGRCNVTNRVVRPADFHGDRSFVAKVLKRFDERRAAQFFEDLGVALKHEPEFDKLFPVSDDAHTVLAALVGECARVGCPVRPGHRVTAVRRDDGAFVVVTSQGEIRARRVVLATGGRSLPRTGSDGFG